jgi:uncharacterized protein YhjY with autotransporter beta-barrel domain
VRYEIHIIREFSMTANTTPQSVLNTGNATLRRRAALLGGAATLSMMLATGAQAQNAIYAQEGQTLDNVTLQQGARLILDISRIDPATGALNLGQNGTNGPVITGTIDATAPDTSLWLIAKETQTRRLVDRPALVGGIDPGFGDAATGNEGIVYEAYGDNTVLTLANPLMRNDPTRETDQTSVVRLAGNGKIVVTANFDVGNGPAIYVEDDSTAALMGEQPDRLDVVLQSEIVASHVNTLIDVRNAKSLALEGTAEVLLTDGTGILASDQHIVIGTDAYMRARDSYQSSANGTQRAIMINMSQDGIIDNYGTLYENGEDFDGTPDNQDGPIEEFEARRSIGVILSGGATFNNRYTGRNDYGRVEMNGAAVMLGNEGGVVNNDGLLQSRFEAAIQTGGRDSAGIDGLDDDGRALVRNNATGQIIGGNGIAYAGGIGTDIVVNAGTITGHVNLNGDGEADFAQRADVFLSVAADASGTATGTVTGTIDGGMGAYDAYGRSFNANGTYTTSNAALTGTSVVNFERHGVEANGASVVATFAANETLTNGLTLMGSGTIVNQADITLDGDIGVVVHDLSDGLRFENEAGAVVTVTGAQAFASENTGLTSFVNRGTFSSDVNDSTPGDAAAVNIIDETPPETFAFNNSGAILNSVGRALNLEMRPDNTRQRGDISFANSGRIEGLSGGARVITAAENRVDFTNSGAGEIVGGRTGLEIRGGVVRGGVDAAGADLSAVNAGRIRSTGEAGTAAAIHGADIMFANSGTILAEQGGFVEDQRTYVSTALALDPGTGGRAIVTNSGLIEARGPNSVAVVVNGGGARFEFTNTGTVRGSGTDTAGPIQGGSSGLPLENGAASAIQTRGSIDKVTNSGEGRIWGNVDLGSENDVFEARGTSRLEGDLRLGTGNDTLLLAANDAISGIAYGGAGEDTLLIDLSAERTLDGSKVSSFETIKREGQGTSVLNVRGTFDVERLTLDGMTVRINQGDTLTTTRIEGQPDVAIEGSDRNETVILAGTVNGDINLGLGDDTIDLANGGVVNGTIHGGVGGNDTIGFRITADADASSIPDVVDFESLRVTGNHTLTLDTAFNTVTLREGADLVIKADAGTIGNIVSDDVSDQNVVVEGRLTGGVNLGAGNDRLVLMDVQGTISNALEGGDGTDELRLNLTAETTFSNGATGFETITVTGAAPLIVNGDFGANQNLNFGEDDNRLEIGAGVTFAGNVNGGSNAAGTDTDTVVMNTGNADQRTTVSGQVNEFEVLTATGEGTLALTGANYVFESATVSGNLELGTNTTLNSAGGVTFDEGANRLVLASGASIIGEIDAGEGEDDTLVLQQAAGTAPRNLSAIGGHDTFEILNTSGAGTFNIDEAATFTSLTVDGGVTNVAVGAVLNAPVTGGANADTVNVAGTLNGTADLGEGDNSLSVAGTMTGNVVTGSGIDTVAVAGTGRLTGDILTGAGNDSVTALGVVDGNIDLGDGNDTFVYGGNVTGSITGGENEGDNDTLEFRTAGTYEAPTVYNGTDFTGFESLAVSGGVVSLSASQEWNDINVAGGRLIGQAGTVITSVGTIDVGQGGTFGSAGTVNGNIVVAQGGILSPGASPGTMIVNGNVTMQRGSNLLIELTPTAGTDLLDVNGTLTIAEGAAIDITGALSSLPGNVLDIVIADTISGRFTTVNKSSTVFGFVVQNGNRIQIRSEFQTDGDMPTNVEASVDYANQVLRSGYGVQAFTSALNVLTDADGTINQRTFAQLTPEAYGSAVQVSVENGLQIVDTTRTLKVTTPKRDGLYGFAQGLIGGGDMRGQADTGASRADYKTNGFFGGVGYGMGEGRMQVGAFLGKIDTDQDLSTLGARTEADGWVAGLYADAAVAGLGVHGMVAYTDTDATTTRNLAVTAEAGRGDYGLKTLVADLSVDYNLEMGGMNVTPKVGVTYVNTKRDGVTEDGAGDFALVVDGASKDAWFADAGVQVSGTMEVAGLGVTPYAEAGVRQMLSDENILVTGHFDGATGAPIVVNGIERDKTVARVGLGFGLDLTENVRFHSGYTTEFSNTNRSSFTAGASIRF